MLNAAGPLIITEAANPGAQHTSTILDTAARICVDINSICQRGTTFHVVVVGAIYQADALLQAVDLPDPYSLDVQYTSGGI